MHERSTQGKAVTRARQNDLICPVPLATARIGVGVQIESSLLLLSRIWSGFLRCGFGWAWLAVLGSGSEGGGGLGRGLSEEPVFGVQSGCAAVRVVPRLPAPALRRCRCCRLPRVRLKAGQAD